MEIDAPPTETNAEPKSSRTSTRTSSRGSRVELITRGEPRRRWSTEQKQAIAAKSFEPGVSSMEVAREYGISSGLISTWRRALLAAQPTSGGAFAQFARVEIARPQRATCKRYGGSRAGFELTIGAAAGPAAMRPGW
jgi:transposase-like protein